MRIERMAGSCPCALRDHGIVPVTCMGMIVLRLRHA